MKKIFVRTGLFLILLSMLPLQSCIGSFSLTHKVIKWNNQVGSKFLNELVFIAFWVLPVYEVTAVADLLVINSIEFWSGTNPVEAYNKTVETDQGTYFITSTYQGYKIKTPNDREIYLDFSKEDQTWSIRNELGDSMPFMTMLDPSHVKMITPSGNFTEVEISENGLMAYTSLIKECYLCLKD